eukprot:CAMPEP_0119064982 /NCGR_PEP_ID=MMETSP1178-20130426/7912_1 /TAXON_ID=33656 /ORGANISM="unid sp, Strain CCMP2000" /LENGTH=69 /DNA_ID=CAMNT_0007046463 /DNA_START=519 /DNA_END=727 /DNA_ORIENTATION=+
MDDASWHHHDRADRAEWFEFHQQIVQRGGLCHFCGAAADERARSARRARKLKLQAIDECEAGQELHDPH